MVLVCYDGGKKRPEDRNNDVLTIFSNFCTFHEKKEWLSIHLWEKKGEWKLFKSGSSKSTEFLENYILYKVHQQSRNLDSYSFGSL